MEKIDIVIQGGMWYSNSTSEVIPYTTALYYLTFPFVNNVIISTWDYEVAKLKELDVLVPESRIKFVFSSPPENDGGGNLNYQIISSAAGIKECTTEHVVKCRSDQTLLGDSLAMMYKFYNKFHTGNQLFVLGIGTHFPYHPQDHIIWGKKEDLANFFDLPLETADATYGPHTDFGTNTLRGPIHLGVHYCARFSEKAKLHASQPKTYLLDKAPKFGEAMQEYFKIMDTCFKAFPRVHMEWHKYGGGYKYDLYAPQGEVYHDEPWGDAT